MRKLLIAATLLVGAIVAAGAASAPADPSRKGAATSVRSTYSHDLLQQDANMTQQMSTPTADGPMQRGGLRDDQLDHSQDPAFVRALEQHQAEVDRMLARPSR